MPLALKDETATLVVTDSELIEGGDKTVTYTLRRLTLAKHRELRRKNTRAGNYKRPERVDEDDFQDDLIDYVLSDWSGVIRNHAPAPCERENKLLIDVPRRIAMLDRAGMNEIEAAEDARGESFRSA